MVKIRRKSKTKFSWNSTEKYKWSFYNIIQCASSGRCLIYNSASGAIAELSRFTEDMYNLETSEICGLAENGIIVPDGLDEFKNQASCVKQYARTKFNFFTIVLTTACNARCFYCYEKNYRIQTVSADSCRKIVNFLADNICSQKEFLLDWYGGEPLLCIKEIDWIIEKLGEKIDLNAYCWTSSMTTNGTLFTEEIISHGIKNWHLSTVHVTLDGTEREHNFRKNIQTSGINAYANTMKSILELLKKGVYVNLRIHLDNKNKDMFSDILHNVKNFFRYSNFHLFPTFLFPPEFEMPVQYIKDEQKEELFYSIYQSLMEYGLIRDYIQEFPWPKNKICFASDPEKVVIAPDGSLHACVQEFDGSDWHDDEKFLECRITAKECIACKYFPICLGGCIHNRSLIGTVRTPCVRNRYIIKPLLELALKQPD